MSEQVSAISAAERAHIRAGHIEGDDWRAGFCIGGCATPFPCPVMRVLDALEAAETREANLNVHYEAMVAELWRQRIECTADRRCLTKIQSNPFAKCNCGAEDIRDAVDAVLAVIHGFAPDGSPV